jgi:type I restriction enzyme, S subunit
VANLAVDSFDIWTTSKIERANGGNTALGQSEYGIKKIRELILELAIRGKLVHQDSKDEPAYKQLKRLKVLQQQLVYSGRARPKSRHQNLGQAEGYYEVPKSWEWEFLAHIPLWPLQDGDWIESKDQDPSGDVRLVQLADVGDRVYRDKSSRFLTSAKAEYLKCTYLEQGDVLIARLPDPLGRACIFPSDDKPCITVVDVAICRCEINTINNRYLMFAQNSQFIRNKIEKYTTGTTRRRISTGNLGRIQIPIPPFSEQRRIVAKVDELMAFCDQLEQKQSDTMGVHQVLVETFLAALTSNRSDFAESWERIVSNFDTLFTTEQSVDKLGQTILQLAVVGKLVPQDPSDEPASVLLEKIAKEKAKLVKEGKLKEQKQLPPIKEDEKPFDLPKGWEWARVADIGHDWGQRKPNSDFSYIDISGIDNVLGIVKSPRILTAANAPSRARKIVKLGTVLYSTVRPYLQNICVINQEYSPQPIASTAFAVLHPFSNMPSKYFYSYFRSPTFVNYVQSVQVGIAYPAINDTQFSRALVPLPPLEEQHRIVAKVDELMALCDKLKANLANDQSIKVLLADSIVEKAIA